MESTFFSCSACNVTICGRDQYHLHLAGEQHRKRTVGETGQQYHCRLCNVVLSGDQCRVEHEKGKSHLSKLRAHENGSGVNPNGKRPRTSSTPFSGFLAGSSSLLGEASADTSPTDAARTPAPDRNGHSVPPVPLRGSNKLTSLDVAARLRNIAQAIESGDYGVSPSVKLEVLSFRGSRGAKQGARFRVATDDVYSGSSSEGEVEQTSYGGASGKSLTRR